MDAYIQKDVPALAAKTTYLLYGFYAQNLATRGPTQTCQSCECHISQLTRNRDVLCAANLDLNAKRWPVVSLILAVLSFGRVAARPGTMLPIAVDSTQTPGLWVRRILENPSKSLGKYASVTTQVISFYDLFRAWCKGTGIRDMFAECSAQDFEGKWGVVGNKMSLQFQYHGLVLDTIADFKNADLFVIREELETTPVDFDETSVIFQKMKGKWA